MSWQDLIDAYEWKARWIPTAIVLLPLFVTAYFCFPDLAKNPILLAGSGLVSVALIYLAAMALRDLGLRCQPKLWQSWGGAPSTRFARAIDKRFDSAHKRRIHNSVRRRFGVALLSEDDEARNMSAADIAIEQAFHRVREFLRQRDSVGLVDKHNAEYGFARNLYAGRELATVIAGFGVLICGFVRSSDSWSFNNVGSEVNALFLVVWIPFAWLFLPDLVKRAAETYAERAWMTFLEIEEAM